MGVISVGASLGVREARATASPAAPSSASNSSTRRSSASTGASGASSSASNSRKKSARKRPAGSGPGAKKRGANYSGNSARSERSPAAAASTAAPSPSARESAPPKAPASVTPSVSMVINGKKPIGRMVHVKTTMDPLRLAPHVIGVNGGKLNAIMSRARCSISYRKTQSQEGGGAEEAPAAFSMAFMISANTAKRVDDGVQLLQAVVESTEQQLRKYEKSGADIEQVHDLETGEEQQGGAQVHVQEVLVEAEGANEEARQQQEENESVRERHAQTRIRQQLSATDAAMQQVSENSSVTGRSRSRSAARDEAPMQLQQQQRPKRRREAGSAATGASRRGRSHEPRESPSRRSERHPAGNEDEECKYDRVALASDAVVRAEEERHLRDEREAFRIRLARTGMISRRLEAEAKRARAQEILERDKYLRLRRKVEEMEHRKKVAEFVVQKQCSAMAASLSTALPSKKRQRLLEIERLSIAHDACPPAASRVLASNLRARSFKAKRADMGKPRVAGLQLIEEDDDLVRLVKKVKAFGKMITSGSIEQLPVDDCSVEKSATHHEDTADAFEFPSEDADISVDASNADDAVADASVEILADDNEEKSNPRRESFRSTWDLPGLTRDLNLIQDYSSETDCKLLRFLAGERQYFYLEPLVNNNLYSNDVERWLLTAHDLQILHRYLLDRADFGKKLVLCAERLRALGTLVPPLPSSTNENLLIGELGVFESSRHKEWSEMQDKIVILHSLALVAHMLGRHYLARQVVRISRDAVHAGPSHENLLGEGTLESDLFTYILRPIRSSAIESSLFDSLPISLVRETIEQCPEVVNHVLQWKGEDDVPEYLREVGPGETPLGDVAATGQRVQPSSSCFLRNLLVRLTAFMRDLDALLKELVTTLKEKRPALHTDNANHVSLRRQRIVEQVNRLKSVATHVVVENTKLQLHKWWILFAENSCAWFDPDDVDEMDDRSYDKFTCLQDALYIWHNEALLYTTKDDFVDPDGLEESPLDHTEEDAAGNGYNTRARASGSSSYSATARDGNRTPMPREEEVAALLRLTPASMRDEVQNRPFTREEAKRCIMTPLKVDKARTQLEKSLAITRDLMNELGRAGPWRTHVKHSNTLKRELAAQVAIQKKLVKHQWARYYTKYQEFAPPPAQAQEVSSDKPGEEDKAPSESAGTQPQGEPTSESGGDATSMAIDWTGVFDPEKDAPDVIEMKKLRHEITLAKDQLLRDISGAGNHGSGAASHSPPLNTDQKALIEECEGLASSCMEALGKFLGMEETKKPPVTPVQKAAPKHPRPATKPARAEKRAASASKGDKTVRGASSSDRRHSHGSKKASAHAKSSPASRSRRSESIRVAKALAASNASLLLPITRSSGSRTSSSRAMSVRSVGNSRGQLPDDNSPLRMGCSGCRDLRRRCTGCSGCCLHCVCVSCGCRMCCSSRLSAVQKTMTHMLDLIESNEACKWMSNASAGNEGHHCGMLFFCQQCHCCEDHCPCLLAGSTSAPAAPSATDPSSGFIASLNATLRGAAPAAAPRRERRFKINPVAAQRRGSNLPTNGIFEGDEPSPASAAAHGGYNGPDREPLPTFHAHHAPGGRGPLPTFDYGIEGAFGLGPMDQRGQCRTWRPAPSDKNEQEDLFRAARVRMKLVRSAFAKSTGPSSGSGCLDGEQLWQPERIRMMWERRDFHGVLGLPRDATTQQIKRQYRKLALKLHPDKASDASASLESTVAEAGKNVGAGNSGKRVDAFVAATHSYKILLGDADAMHGLGFQAGQTADNMDVNRIFSAEQIAVPPDLPHVLKDWTKAVIRENPADLLAFSQQWFQDKAALASQRKAAENQIRRMRQLFESYDVDGQGRMEAKDLGKFLGEDLGMDGYEDGSPAELLEDLVMELDPDNTGFIELHDIIQWYQQR
ncbi:hypothetical protein PHYPSEUDO_002503 [Phytophthora pseudosyringae]|uniref:Uncharacterized protein n=1 Tax=Phytophthora pseudosyringae TaxID=221518 RepID=A0A8T1VT41_9STRA|nr:hypothetical protein PHYPSEUDO_002503 [Phytophthora pseudosyringae]